MKRKLKTISDSPVLSYTPELHRAELIQKNRSKRLTSTFESVEDTFLKQGFYYESSLEQFKKVHALKKRTSDYGSWLVECLHNYLSAQFLFTHYQREGHPDEELSNVYKSIAEYIQEQVDNEAQKTKTSNRPLDKVWIGDESKRKLLYQKLIKESFILQSDSGIFSDTPVVWIGTDRLLIMMINSLKPKFINKYNTPLQKITDKYFIKKNGEKFKNTRQALNNIGISKKIPGGFDKISAIINSL